MQPDPEDPQLLLPVSPEVFNEIPPLSILRESIGGNTLYMKGHHQPPDGGLA